MTGSLKLLLQGALLVLVVLALAAGALIVDFKAFLAEPVDPGENGQIFEIEPGTPFQALARELEQRGIITNAFYWTLLARLEDRAHSIKAGEYRLDAPVTPVGLLDMFAEGRTTAFDLTIPEGWTFRQMLDAVQAHPKITAVLGEGEDVMARLGKPGENPEGWFYPDTYRFSKGTTDEEFLRRAHDTMRRRLELEWKDRAEGLPLKTPYEALILASIVEKETSVPDERPLIAAVFISRLNRGMRLQTDPTVIYGMGESYDGNIRSADLKRATPYNTYVRKGLPPTPIALPGGAALHAVLHPADSKALYFVSMGNGRHYFSNTYDEHRKAVIKYQLKGNARRYRGGEGS